MAITENQYTGNGSTVLYSFTFPYLETTDIKVSLDGTVTTAYTLANATTIEFNTAPANGVAIRIYRVTDDAALSAQFYPGSAIRSTDLNDNFTQNLYVTQESNRDATQAITTADAATATANTALSNSSAAVSTANAASASAAAAVSTANTASSNASAAVSTANTASTNATTAVNTANAATATANSAASDAATAISTANSAVSTANTASTTATNAVNTANSASSAASSAVSTANTASSNASAAVSTANTASSNATTAVNTANTAISTANAASAAVASAVIYQPVVDLAALALLTPVDGDFFELQDSTGADTDPNITGVPGGLVGAAGLTFRLRYDDPPAEYVFLGYFANDSETRYLKEAGDTMTGALGVTTGTAAAPSVFISGDPNTGIYSPGADQVAVATNGTGRLFVASNGNVGVGAAVSSPGRILHVDSASTSNSYIRFTNSNSTGNGAEVGLFDSGAANPALVLSNTMSDGNVVINTNGTERMRITSAGLVGIGTSSPGALTHLSNTSSSTGYNFFQITAGSESQVHTIKSTISTGRDLEVNSARTLKFTTGSNTGAFASEGHFQFSHGTNGDLVRITADGKVGIGTTSPPAGALLAVNGQPWVLNQNALLFMNADNTLGCYINGSGAGGANPDMVFSTSYNERARIDSSGRLGIGTSSPANVLELAGNNSAGNGIGNVQGILRVNNNITAFGSSPTAGIVFATKYRSSPDIPLDGAAIYGGKENTSDANKSFFLAFATRAESGNNGNEAMRIDSSGRLGIGTSNPQVKSHIVDTNGDVLRLQRDGAFTGSWGVKIGQAITGDFTLRDEENNLNVISIPKGSGRVGIGTTPDSRLHVLDSSGNSLRIGFGSNLNIYDAAAHVFRPNGGASEYMRIDASGRLLVGTSTDINSQQIQSASTGGNNFGASRFTNGLGGCDIFLTKSRGATVGTHTVVQSGDDLGNLYFRGSDGSSYVSAARISVAVDGTPGANDMPGRLVFSTTADGASSPTERMRITSGGAVLVGTTDTTLFDNTSGSGIVLDSVGAVQIARSAEAGLFVNRMTNDGVLVAFYQAGTFEGDISVSGTTISYNGAHLSRWSQLPAGAERKEILRGSVLTNIDEMCEWGEEDNEQLNRMKVSDVEGDKNVSGVFQAWDDDDDTYTNDFYCAMTGDFIIRIAEGVTVERGDLLMSAGDGTAKPQDDDIIRSKTIAKVTSTNVSCTYDDGSYCVPCVLMAC